MAGEIISLLSSSPERPRAKPRDAPPNPRKRPSDSALSDLTDGAVNARAQPEKRARHEPQPRGGSVLDRFDLSDFSDPLDLPEPAAEPKPKPVAKDPARVFGSGRGEAARSPGGKAAGVFSTRRVHAFDDPIELSSTPDPMPKRQAESRASAVGKTPDRVESDPFSFSPSPGRGPRPSREQKTGRDYAGPRQRRTTPPRDAPRPAHSVDSPSPAPGPSPHRLHKEWDPISSSAPEPQNAKVITLDSDSDAPPDLLLSDDSFPDLQDLRAAPRPPRDPLTRHNTTTGPSRPKPRTSLKRASSYTPASTAAPRKTAEERARDKELRAAARESEKARKKAEREELRAAKEREKERAAALAEVNKVRTDKRIAAGEMIVDMPPSLDEAVALQARTLLSDLGVESAEWESPLPRVIRWRRKVRSQFNEALGYYEPIPQRIEKEDLMLVVMGAEEFVDACLGVDGRDLDRHVRMLRRHFPGHGLLYLIEGLEPWTRRNRNLRNRQFAAAARGTDAPSRRSNARDYVDEEVVEDALLALQVQHGARIHHTAAGIETARWITTFTQHLSTAPYRRRRDEANASAAAFCMDAGQVRSGEDGRDAYVKLLQEVNRVTAPVAYGVAAEFESVGELVRGLEGRGPLGVAECRKGVNREGELGERTVGQALSRRFYKVFTGRDEESTDV